MRSGAFVALALCLASTLPAAAQQPVTLQFKDGRVTLQARNAPVRTILAEWARLGSATIVNGDRVAGPPVTLDLTNVPERQALDIILRSVAGYMLAPRRAGSVGASAFDRIMILPTSAAPRNPPPPAAAGLRPGIPRPAVMAPPPEAGVELQTDSADDAAADVDQAANPAVILPGNIPRMVPPTIVRPLPGADAAEANEPETGGPEGPSPGARTPTPSNPFGTPAGSSTRPGVISPAPRPQQQGQTNRVQ
jgi:hypothetical protein